jgi:hypothetical protein
MKMQRWSKLLLENKGQRLKALLGKQTKTETHWSKIKRGKLYGKTFKLGWYRGYIIFVPAFLAEDDFCFFAK